MKKSFVLLVATASNNAAVIACVPSTAGDELACIFGVEIGRLVPLGIVVMD